MTEPQDKHNDKPKGVESGDWDIPLLSFPSITDPVTPVDGPSLSFPSADATADDSPNLGNDATNNAPTSTEPLPSVDEHMVFPRITGGSTSIQEPAVAESGTPLNDVASDDQPTQVRPALQDEPTVAMNPVPQEQDLFAAAGANATTIATSSNPVANDAPRHAIAAEQTPAQPAPNLPPSVNDTTTILPPVGDPNAARTNNGIGGLTTGSAAGTINRKPIIIGVAAAVLIAAGVGGAFAFNRHQQQTSFNAAIAACRTAADNVAKGKSALDAALLQANDAKQITSDQVADPSTLTALETAISGASDAGDASACDANLDATTIAANTNANTALAEKLNGQTSTVTSAVTAVTDSQKQKSDAAIAAAKQSLQTAVGNAQTLMTSSEGSASDESRQSLQSAIDAANTLLAASDPKLDDLNNASTALQNAMDAVNDSMDSDSGSSSGNDSDSSSHPNSSSNGSRNNSSNNSSNGGSTSHRGNSNSGSSTHSGTSNNNGNGSTGSGNSGSGSNSGTGNNTQNNNTGSNNNGTNNGSGNGNNSGNSGNTDSGTDNGSGNGNGGSGSGSGTDNGNNGGGSGTDNGSGNGSNTDNGSGNGNNSGDNGSGNGGTSGGTGGGAY
ncbi:hypothetical protein [Bifidobacterium vespertilionis]|uniref:hypothetical protein n=1 Tax=Bifidobacterium vespertilionis TaxID=2562524 RepID=UPI001BDCC3DC|nr:hypothetical protein [Bifidobacterium vespertilionis]MBT1179164.1 hypothetical protein [Bifidobacterium vespertilionis]